MSALVRTLAAALLPLAIAACGAPAVTPAASPTPPKESGPAPLPAAPETPDAAFRYVPPDLGKAMSVRVAPVEVRLDNGVVGRFVEAPNVPIVATTVVVRWKSPAPIAGTGHMLGEILEETTLASGRTLREELADLGAVLGAFSFHDALFLQVMTLRPLAEQALGHVLVALRTGKLDAAALDRARKAQIDGAPARPSHRERLDRALGEHLYPAAHPYHDRVHGTAESLKKLKIEDLTRYRDAAMTPDAVAVTAAGAMSQADFGAMLGRLAGAWTPSKAAAKSAASTPTPPARGVFLVEDAADETIELSLLFPAPKLDHGDIAAINIAWSVIFDRIRILLDERIQGQWTRSQYGTQVRVHGAFVQWFVTAKRGHSAGALDVALQAIDAVARGDFSDADLTQARHHRANRDLGLDNLVAATTLMGLEAAMLSRPGSLLEESATLRAVTRQEVIHAAQTYFKKELASVIAVGPVTSEKAAMEKLGLGPVTIPGEAPPKTNDPKKAPAKGAKK